MARKANSGGVSVEDHRGAHQVAEAAAALLGRLRDEAPAPVRDPEALGREGDRRSNELIITELSKLFPDDAIFSEESADDLRRLRAERVWIVDPLDGTNEFYEGRDDFAVHVALVMGEAPVAGAVALPGRGMVISTASLDSRRGTGSTGGQPPKEADGGPARGSLRWLVSRSRADPLVLTVARHLDGEVIAMGSAGAKAMAVVLGEADVYAHAGGQYEWDSAAPVAVALAAGVHASRLDGSPLRYNQRDPWLPDLLVCKKDVAKAVLDALSEIL